MFRIVLFEFFKVFFALAGDPWLGFCERLRHIKVDPLQFLFRLQKRTD